MDLSLPDRDEVNINHPAWRSLVGVGVGYFVLLAAVFVLLFVVPYILYSAL